MTDPAGSGRSSAKKAAAVADFAARVEDACRGVGETLASVKPGDGGPTLKELVHRAGSLDRARLPAALERLRHGGDPQGVFAASETAPENPALDPAHREWVELLLRLRHCRAEALGRFQAALPAGRVLLDPWFEADQAFLTALAAAVEARRAETA